MLRITDPMTACNLLAVTGSAAYNGLVCCSGAIVGGSRRRADACWRASWRREV